MRNVWVYLNSEPHLWTVGFYDPKDQWHADSDHESREQAAIRVMQLNGGGKQEQEAAASQLREALEERDAALLKCDEMAQQTIYHGNSVGWWYEKAIAYKNALSECWRALKEAGIYADGQTDVADAIRKLAERNSAHLGKVL